MRAERLRLTKDIDLVRETGAKRSDRHFSARIRPNDLGTVRIAVVSSRAVGSAVKRSRARRRVREAIRTQLRERSDVPGADMVVVARPAALHAAPAELRDAVARQLVPVLGRDD